MTLFSLLTKELRTRLRSERTVWVMVIYILLLVLIGWGYLSLSGYNLNNLSMIGSVLYTLLAMVQLALLIFITPAFTSTAINGEKERQTFDLLLCSRLSSFSLVVGKMLAGLTNSLLLIAASIPVFSLVLFFGGISPAEMLLALLIYVVTALVVGSFGLFCSTVFKRPSLSTSITYVLTLAWVLVPLGLMYVFIFQPATRGINTEYFLIAHPAMALVDIANPNTPNYTFGALHWNLAPWVAYVILCLIGTLIFILLSMLMVKPRRISLRKRGSASTLNSAPVSA